MDRLGFYRKELQILRKKPFWNRGRIKDTKVKIQALEEGQADDVLTSSATGVSTAGDGDNKYKNRFPTYTEQVHDINDMYNSRTEFGSEFLRAVLDTRVSFIAGEGLVIKAKNKQLTDWINQFLDFNKLRSSKLMDAVLLSEMEGKSLMGLFPSTKDEKIKVKLFSYYVTPYRVVMDDFQLGEITKIEATRNEQDIVLTPDRAVYVKIGGSPDRVNRTVPRIANVLTDIDNGSRTRYDLRHNNHLFGKITPYFKTETSNEAKSLYEKIIAKLWKPGSAFAGTADYSLVEPAGNAINSLKEELVISMKHISLNTGIPIQWLAYPELLSNRATADNMIEMINSATIRERILWQEGLTDLIRKAMAISFEKGWIKFNKPDDFKIEIPNVSIALLQQISSVWIPLEQNGYISKETVMGKVPGIDPIAEKKIIDKEKEENMARFQENMTGNNAIANAIEQNNQEEKENNEFNQNKDNEK
jgi:hypothetical protein